MYYRNKSGLWGWRTDRTEAVNGRDCKVFGASNVELVTKSRTEHLSDQEKERLLASQQSSRFPLNSLLAAAQVEEADDQPVKEKQILVCTEPWFLTSYIFGHYRMKMLQGPWPSRSTLTRMSISGSGILDGPRRRPRRSRNSKYAIWMNYSSFREAFEWNFFHAL